MSSDAANPDPVSPEAVLADPEALPFSTPAVCVVEPHADDAMLSLGSSIATWLAAGRRVTICTVFWPDDERAREARDWAEWVGADWHGVGLSNAGDHREVPSSVVPDALLGPDVTTIWPLGIGHGDHRLVRAVGPIEALCYLDSPYQVVPQLAAETRAALRGTTVEWWHVPRRSKWDGADCFPTQQALFDTFGDTLRHQPELVVRTPPAYSSSTR